MIPDASGDWFKGKQVLNFFPRDKYYKDIPGMEEFVKEEFKGVALDTDAEIMRVMLVLKLLHMPVWRSSLSQTNIQKIMIFLEQ
ncbi:MAG: hypothetical protein JSS07_01255 [Proteobacteria bacterium]|nr:hypothetical protein [Pseudomonadota bacterium]